MRQSSLYQKFATIRAVSMGQPGIRCETWTLHIVIHLIWHTLFLLSIGYEMCLSPMACVHGTLQCLQVFWLLFLSRPWKVVCSGFEYLHLTNDSKLVLFFYESSVLQIADLTRLQGFKQGLSLGPRKYLQVLIAPGMGRPVIQ